MFTKFHRLFTVPLFVLVVLGTAVFVMSHKVTPAYSELSDNLSGHAWDMYYGWTSYNNCNNDYEGVAGLTVDSNNCLVSSDFGLDMTITTDVDTGEVTGGSISGFMWNSNVGWICVGSTCAAYNSPSQCGSDITPPSGSLSMQFGAPDVNGWAELSGWGKICAWGNDGGTTEWISFNCSQDSACSSDHAVYVNVYDYTMGAPSGVSWEDVGNPGPNFGYAWNGYTVNGQQYGMGHIAFNPLYSAAHAIYFKTEDGDVYAYGDIAPLVDVNDIDSSIYNAAFLVMSNGDVRNFTTAEANKNPSNTESYIRDTDTGPVDFGGILKEDVPGTQEYYYNNIDFLDIAGMEAGEYGTAYNLGSDDDASGAGITNAILLGMVYVRDGDFYFDAEVTFDNGCFFGSCGLDASGTLIIKGDLYIEENTYYGTGNVDQLVSLPSAATIVLGDLYISPNVTQISGSLLVLGNGNACPTDLQADPAGCGRISTGTNGSDDVPLTIDGLVMARQFHLQRQYSDVTNQPAELFRFDGRMIANAPPGFQSLVTDLPTLVENAPF